MTEFHNCRLLGASFVDSRWTGVAVDEGDWSYAILRGVSLGKIDLRRVRLIEADFYGADLQNADLRKANLAKAKLKGANLRHATVEGIDFQTVDLRGVKLDAEQAVHVAKAYGALIG